MVWLVGLLVACLLGRLAGSFLDCWVCFLAWVVVWLVRLDWLVGLSWSVGWHCPLIGWLVVRWLVGRLAELVGWLGWSIV